MHIENFLFTYETRNGSIAKAARQLQSEKEALYFAELLSRLSDSWVGLRRVEGGHISENIAFFSAGNAKTPDQPQLSASR